MPIATNLPAGFLSLTMPGAFALRALGLMIANTTAWQEWVGVGRWQDACSSVSLIADSSDMTPDGMVGVYPRALVDMSAQSWARFDRTEGMCESVTFPLLLIDKRRFEELDLATLDYLEREGRLIDGLHQLAGTTWSGETQTWPVIASATLSGPVVSDVIDGAQVLMSRWEIAIGGYT